MVLLRQCMKKCEFLCWFTKNCVLLHEIENKQRLKEMVIDNQKQEELRQKIETVSGISPKSPREFEYLSMSIFARTRKKISSTTLKRMWGYIERDSESQIRESTLDILATFVGYVSWQAFCKSCSGGESSDFLATKEIHVENLQVWNTIRLLWKPDRCVTIRFEGGDLFTVVESINSKLMTSDTFHCSYIIEKQPLILTQLARKGMDPCSYICGKDGGVMFEIL